MLTFFGLLLVELTTQRVNLHSDAEFLTKISETYSRLNLN